MADVGLIALVLVAIAIFSVLAVGLWSLPDFRRYRGLRRL